MKKPILLVPVLEGYDPPVLSLEMSYQAPEGVQPDPVLLA